MSLMKEFKDFAMRGNVVDMAVGIIIGGAFGKIVSSLVGDVVMPALGKVLGGTNFNNLFFWLGKGDKPKTLADAKTTGEAYLGYGAFLQATVDFIIVAFAIFILVKAINTARARLTAPDAPPPAAPPPEDVLLLREIRDALKNRP